MHVAWESTANSRQCLLHMAWTEGCLDHVLTCVHACEEPWRVRVCAREMLAWLGAPISGHNI